MWRAREIESEISAGGSSQIPFAFQRLLRLRGVNLEAASHFLNPRISDLRDPYLMTNMKKAIDRLCLAFERGEKVAVYGDFDLDGTSGLALLYQGLTSLGFKNVGRYQPKRLSEGYGLHYGGLKDLSEQGYSLVVTVDVGITAIKTCELAKDLPLEVIITDHHLPEETLPAAFAVVNPNQNDDTSGLGYLCGAGVGFYLLRALKRGFMERGWVEEANRCDLKEALEFFTIATLTDMVPLVEDNRALVKMGLQKLSQTNKPGLKQLLKELKMDQKLLTGQDVAIRFAPKLNALSRMESEVLPIDLYLAATEQEAIRLVEVVHRTNSNRVKFQNDAFEEALLKASEQTEWPFIFIASPKFHRGVVGIVASKLCETFGKPSFVGSVDPDGLTVVGSARRPDESNLHLVELLHAAAEHFERSGGHAGAAGFEFKSHNLENIINAFRNHFLLQGFSTDPLPVFYDIEMDLKDLNTEFLKWMDLLEPFGAGFEAPLFHLPGLIVDGFTELKGGHMKIKVRSPDGGKAIDAVAFSPSKSLRDRLPKARQIDILGEVQKNYFRGNQQIQILIQDVKVTL